MKILRERLPIILFAGIFVGLIVIFGVNSQGFFSVNNLLGILRQVAIIAIAALGVTFVATVGHTDISFYLVACFAAMMMGFSISLGLPAIAAILIGLACALAFAVGSAAAVGIIGLPDIIITIAIGTIAFGCAYLPSNGARIYAHFDSSGIGFINDGRILGIQTPIFLMLVLYVVSYIVLERTKAGTAFYATGFNKVAASFSGIKVRMVVFMAFIICILLGSFAGEINTASVGNAEVTTALTFLLPSYTAVFIGKAIFKRPSVIGTLLGALLLQIVSNGYTHMNIKFWISDLTTSGLLIASLLISLLNNRENARSVPAAPTQIKSNQKLTGKEQYDEQ